jgi:hypothetical protein
MGRKSSIIAGSSDIDTTQHNLLSQPSCAILNSKIALLETPEERAMETRNITERKTNANVSGVCGGLCVKRVFEVVGGESK